MNPMRLLTIGTVLLAAAGCSTAGGTSSIDVPVNAFAAQGAEKHVERQLIAALDGGIISQSSNGKLTNADMELALDAEYRALEYGESGKLVTWVNPANGDSGEVLAAQPYRVGSQDCRSYKHTVFATAGPISASGTACRNPDGSWTPLS
jgi:surface antigen